MTRQADILAAIDFLRAVGEIEIDAGIDPALRTNRSHNRADLGAGEDLTIERGLGHVVTVFVQIVDIKTRDQLAGIIGFEIPAHTFSVIAKGQLSRDAKATAKHDIDRRRRPDRADGGAEVEVHPQRRRRVFDQLDVLAKEQAEQLGRVFDQREAEPAFAVEVVLLVGKRTGPQIRHEVIKFGQGRDQEIAAVEAVIPRRVEAVAAAEINAVHVQRAEIQPFVSADRSRDADDVENILHRLGVFFDLGGAIDHRRQIQQRDRLVEHIREDRQRRQQNIQKRLQRRQRIGNRAENRLDELGQKLAKSQGDVINRECGIRPVARHSIGTAKRPASAQNRIQRGEVRYVDISALTIFLEAEPHGDNHIDIGRQVVIDLHAVQTVLGNLVKAQAAVIVSDNIQLDIAADARFGLAGRHQQFEEPKPPQRLKIVIQPGGQAGAELGGFLIILIAPDIRPQIDPLRAADPDPEVKRPVQRHIDGRAGARGQTDPRQAQIKPDIGGSKLDILTEAHDDLDIVERLDGNVAQVRVIRLCPAEVPLIILDGPVTVDISGEDNGDLVIQRTITIGIANSAAEHRTQRIIKPGETGIGIAVGRRLQVVAELADKLRRIAQGIPDNGQISAKDLIIQQIFQKFEDQINRRTNAGEVPQQIHIRDLTGKIRHRQREVIRGV